ncbi:restriction endonuclease subunit S [Shewanella sp. SR43-4]|uniref:restriction endonuclease subunit S n=1 Tax=Shewanella sp. SR43-4 TaxID=2760942 RepID=UPI0015FB4AD0|nr:restriction endonuclease subunit S [Shewanella sp. SR43-4]MBB1318080.1 restriction endonuclease subunit S [Shewanella sp. SR43-4]
MSELPKGWVSTKFTKVLDVSGGTQPPKSEFIAEPKEGYIRLLQIRDFGSKPVPTYIPDTHKLRKCTQEDILIGRYGASIGRICTGMEGAFNVALAKVVTPKGIDSKFLKYYLKSELFQNPLAMLSRSAQNGFNKTDLSNFDFWLAPLNEQIRIADKLDSILAKVDQAQARLEKIPGILKRFRQSVLAAATSGELTKEWRGKDESFETEIPDFFIPIEWKYSNIEEIGVVKGGKRLPKGEELTEVDTGLPYIRAGQLKNGTVIQGDNARNKQMFLQPETQAQIKRYTVNEGDAYLTIVGASIGDAGIIPKALHLANLTENAAKITDLKSLINTSFLSLWLRSEKLQQLIQLEIKSGAQGKLALKRINTLPVPLPPLDEQKEIVRRVEVLFSYAANVEENYQEMKSRVDRLTQSVLAKAFRGELVQQDSNDEPASELLKRIKSSEVESKPKKKTSPKRKAAATTTKKNAKQVTPNLSEQFEETFNVDLDAEKHEVTDSMRTRYQSEIKKAQDSLLDAKFSVEQFRSVTEFKGDYESLKTLIMNLLKGIPGISEPILEIESWDEKNGDYLMRLVDQK